MAILLVSPFMASFHPHRNGYRVHIYVRGVLRKIWLGQCSKSQASYVTQHIDQLRIAAEIGAPIPPGTAEWLSNVGPRIKSKLIEFGLLAAGSQFPLELEPFIDAYIITRTDWRPRTESRMRNSKRHLVRQLGADTSIPSVTPGDAERFARWCRANFKSQSHSGKTIADARQYFAAAVKERIITQNPFTGINASQPHNKERETYVTQQTIDDLMAATSKEIAAILACARYGGLRIPSECQTLDWHDIDWDTGKVRVIDAKRKTVRIVPLFPKWRQALSDWFAIAPERQEVFEPVTHRAYRKRFLDLLERQKVKPWPKLWQNLRASCETDLKRQFPGEHHAVHYWVGNSARVSSKHYDRISEDVYERAVG